MDYEKKYNEALGWMRSIYPTLTGATKEDAEHYFPELRESEDERISDTIFSCLHQCCNAEFISEKQRDDALAWLEKQKINTEGDFARGYDCGYECCLNSHGAEWLEKQKEQEHICDSAQYEEGFKTGLEIGLRKQEEQKPAEWSEDNKDYYDTIVRKLEVIGDDSGLSNNQIKFLREHCPSHRSEWSEEDEKMLDSYADEVTDWCGKFNPEYKDVIRATAYHFYCFRPSWKPSEEQMDAIKKAWITCKDDEVCKQLALLWNDLHELQTK